MLAAGISFLRFAWRVQSQGNDCQGNGKKRCNASVTAGKKVGRAVLCPPRRARSARPTSRDRRITKRFQAYSLANIALTALWHFASSILPSARVITTAESSLWSRRAALRPLFADLFVHLASVCARSRRRQAGIRLREHYGAAMCLAGRQTRRHQVLPRKSKWKRRSLRPQPPA